MSALNRLVQGPSPQARGATPIPGTYNHLRMTELFNEANEAYNYYTTHSLHDHDSELPEMPQFLHRVVTEKGGLILVGNLRLHSALAHEALCIYVGAKRRAGLPLYVREFFNILKVYLQLKYLLLPEDMLALATYAPDHELIFDPTEAPVRVGWESPHLPQIGAFCNRYLLWTALQNPHMSGLNTADATQLKHIVNGVEVACALAGMGDGLTQMGTTTEKDVFDLRLCRRTDNNYHALIAPTYPPMWNSAGVNDFQITEDRSFTADLRPQDRRDDEPQDLLAANSGLPDAVLRQQNQTPARRLTQQPFGALAVNPHNAGVRFQAHPRTFIQADVLTLRWSPQQNNLCSTHIPQLEAVAYNVERRGLRGEYAGVMYAEARATPRKVFVKGSTTAMVGVPCDGFAAHLWWLGEKKQRIRSGQGHLVGKQLYLPTSNEKSAFVVRVKAREKIHDAHKQANRDTEAIKCITDHAELQAFNEEQHMHVLNARASWGNMIPPHRLDPGQTGPKEREYHMVGTEVAWRPLIVPNIEYVSTYVDEVRNRFVTNYQFIGSSDDIWSHLQYAKALVITRDASISFIAQYNPSTSQGLGIPDFDLDALIMTIHQWCSQPQNLPVRPLGQMFDAYMLPGGTSYRVVTFTKSSTLPDQQMFLLFWGSYRLVENMERVQAINPENRAEEASDIDENDVVENQQGGTPDQRNTNDENERDRPTGRTALQQIDQAELTRFFSTTPTYNHLQAFLPPPTPRVYRDLKLTVSKIDHEATLGILWLLPPAAAEMLRSALVAANMPSDDYGLVAVMRHSPQMMNAIIARHAQRRPAVLSDRTSVGPINFSSTQPCSEADAPVIIEHLPSEARRELQDEYHHEKEIREELAVSDPGFGEVDFLMTSANVARKYAAIAPSTIPPIELKADGTKGPIAVAHRPTDLQIRPFGAPNQSTMGGAGAGRGTPPGRMGSIMRKFGQSAAARQEVYTDFGDVNALHQPTEQQVVWLLARLQQDQESYDILHRHFVGRLWGAHERITANALLQQSGDAYSALTSTIEDFGENPDQRTPNTGDKRQSDHSSRPAFMAGGLGPARTSRDYGISPSSQKKRRMGGGIGMDIDIPVTPMRSRDRGHGFVFNQTPTSRRSSSTFPIIGGTPSTNTGGTPSTNTGGTPSTNAGRPTIFPPGTPRNTNPFFQSPRNTPSTHGANSNFGSPRSTIPGLGMYNTSSSYGSPRAAFNPHRSSLAFLPASSGGPGYNAPAGLTAEGQKRRNHALVEMMHGDDAQALRETLFSNDNLRNEWTNLRKIPQGNVKEFEEASKSVRSYLKTANPSISEDLLRAFDTT